VTEQSDLEAVMSDYRAAKSRLALLERVAQLAWQMYNLAACDADDEAEQVAQVLIEALEEAGFKRAKV
jgi:hypothetical protein